MIIVKKSDYKKKELFIDVSNPIIIRSYEENFNLGNA